MPILLLVWFQGIKTTNRFTLLAWLSLIMHTVFILLCFVGLITGSPLLGATETVKAVLSGLTFGLPVSEVKNLFL